MTILLLGGRGKTASRIASQLHKDNIAFVVASRSSASDSPYMQAKFDWLDDETWDTPFTTATSEDLNPISAVWLVPPPIFDLSPPMIKFVDFAVARGAKRFVLLSASMIEQGGPAMGEVHAHLAQQSGIEFVVLRPTWFMHNFSAPTEPQRLAIRDEDKVYSAAGDGKVPFISADDIARCATAALTDTKIRNSDHIIVGPESLSYDEVASILTEVLGRKITHCRISESEVAKRLEAGGMVREEAEMVASLDQSIKEGNEDIRNDEVERLSGRAPQTFRDFALAEKEAWVK